MPFIPSDKLSDDPKYMKGGVIFVVFCNVPHVLKEHRVICSRCGKSYGEHHYGDDHEVLCQDENTLRRI